MGIENPRQRRQRIEAFQESIGQQPSKTPRTDAAFINAVNAFNLRGGGFAHELSDFARQLETELSTANAEVERLKHLVSDYEADISVANEKCRNLLANSKALAAHLDVRDRIALREELLAAHNKLMEQFPEAKG